MMRHDSVDRRIQCATCKWCEIRKKHRTNLSDIQAPCEYDPFGVCIQNKDTCISSADILGTIFTNTDTKNFSYALWEVKPELVKGLILPFLQPEEFAV